MTGRTPRLDVWVCARPQAPHLTEVMAALAASGAEPRVATAAPGHGPSAARNEALARCDGDVLVLVDDDVEVSPGWLDALQATWSGPGAEGLGCVGGPLDAGLLGERPAWLSDALLPALGVDTGPSPEREPEPGPGGPQAVEAGQRTFHGGNVSFRAAALRGVGGFWPARGHPGLRDWFCEEHRAQHELARAGWRSAWVAESRAVRRIDCAALHAMEVVRLRGRSGVRSAAVGAASGRDAARAAARSGAGVLSALLGRDPETVVERAARTAQNLGVVAAPLLSHRDLQPTAVRTEFTYSVPPAVPGPLRACAPRLARRLGRRVRGATPLVLLYHRVAEGPEDPMGLMVSPRHFAEQLEVLGARRRPATLEEVVAGEAPPDSFALTFDDGYVDVLDAALPALQAARFPATVFISTRHVESGRAFWWDALARMIRLAPTDVPPLELAVGADARTWPARDPLERRTALRFLAAWLHGCPPEAIDEVLRAIAAWAGVGDPSVPSTDDRPLTVEELRRLAASPVVTIGSHGRDHACLAALSPERQAMDLRAAHADLSRWLSRAPAGLAYPFGVPGVDVDTATRHAAREAGYAYAVVNIAGPLPRRADRLAFPRAAVPDVGADGFDAWLRERAVQSRASTIAPLLA